MLEAGGIDVFVGASGHASVEMNSLALGGHRLWVPASQHRAASILLIAVLGGEEWEFSRGLQRAILRFCGVWAALWTALSALWWLYGGGPLLYLLVAPLDVLTIPVNPQGRGDYYLAADA